MDDWSVTFPPPQLYLRLIATLDGQKLTPLRSEAISSFNIPRDNWQLCEAVCSLVNK